jgi:hypothetical protein
LDLWSNVTGEIGDQVWRLQAGSNNSTVKRVVQKMNATQTLKSGVEITRPTSDNIASR